MPIVPVVIKSGDVRASYKTVLSYGRSRSGKTRWLGTWPRVLVLAEASERGWTTFETMPSEVFFEPDRPPLVWPIENAMQMEEALIAAEPMVQSGEVLTVGIDSLTFYQDSYFAMLKERWIKGNPGKALDNFAVYGALAEHLHSLRQRIHRWPCNVVWLALEQPATKDAPTGGPLLAGKAKERFPAGCDFIFYHRSYSFPSETPGAPADVYYEMHTAPYEKWLAGGRDSGLLEACIFNANYRDFATALGLPDPVEAFKAAKKAAPPQRRVVTPPAATPATDNSKPAAKQ